MKEKINLSYFITEISALNKKINSVIVVQLSFLKCARIYIFSM